MYKKKKATQNIKLKIKLQHQF